MSRKRTKRRGSYQSLVDVQEDSAMRKAGDAITEEKVIEALADNILAELRGETAIDTAMQDAMEYLPRRRAQLAELGATEEDINRLSDIVPNEIPQALVKRYSDGEVSTHTEYIQDPTTEQNVTEDQERIWLCNIGKGSLCEPNNSLFKPENKYCS